MRGIEERCLWSYEGLGYTGIAESRRIFRRTVYFNNIIIKAWDKFYTGVIGYWKLGGGGEE